MSHERRSEDPRIAKLVTDVASLQTEMSKNTEVTTQIRDMMRSFKILGSIAKWATVLGTVGTSLYHGVKFVASRL